MAKDNGFIDLGQKYDPKAEVMAKEDGPRVNYPTVFISHDMGDNNALDSLPDGEFEFTGKGKIISYKEDKKTDKCQCEIELMAIKPSTTKAKKVKSTEDNLDEAFDKVAAQKSKQAAPEESDEDPAEEASETPAEEADEDSKE